jgi:hypothetical protein
MNSKRWIPFSTIFLIISAAGPLCGAEHAHSLGVSLKFAYHDYKEINEPDWFKSDEKGVLPGIHCSYAYQGMKNPFYGRLLFEYTAGKTDYDGTTQAGSPLQTKTYNRFESWEGNIGLRFQPDPGHLQAQVTFYTGVGYRYWNRGLGGQAPFSEEYSWKYIPVGMLISYPISKKWRGEVEMAAWFIFDAAIKVNLSEADPNYNNPQAALGNTLGWRIEVPFHYQFSKHWSLNIVPSFENYSFGKSDTFRITYAGMPTPFVGHEPDSRTSIYSLRLGFSLHF